MARARLAAPAAVLLLLLAPVAYAICDTNALPTLKPVRFEAVVRPGRRRRRGAAAD
jgi:hypothetical protein